MVKGEENGDGDIALSGRLNARFAHLCQVGLGMNKDTQYDELLGIFRELKPFLTSIVVALGSDKEEAISKVWNACIVYCTSRLDMFSSFNRVAASGCAGSFTLSKLLKAAEVCAWDFFRELPQFLQRSHSVLRTNYGSSCDKLAQQVKQAQVDLVHLAALFKTYKQTFQNFFGPPDCERLPPDVEKTSDSAHLRFGWMLFLAVRAHVLCPGAGLAICTDGLIAIFVIMLLHMPIHFRRIAFDDRETFAIRNENGIRVVASLCDLYGASEKDVNKMLAKANPVVAKILKICPMEISGVKNHVEYQLEGVDKEGLMFFDHLMEEGVIESHLRSLDKDYEEYYETQQRELDGRMFLSGEVLPSYSVCSMGKSTLSPSKQKHEAASSPMKSGNPRSYMHSLNASQLTVAEWLQTVVAPLPSHPPHLLLDYFKASGAHITRQVTDRAQTVLEAILSTQVEFFKGNLNLGSEWMEKFRLETLKLYYRVLEAMCRAEAERLQSNNLWMLLSNERFHRCMLACSAELVLASHKITYKTLPDVLTPIGITAFDLSKIMDSFVRHEETLPSDLRRHLDSIEEKLLESWAWQSGSSMYNSLIIAKPNLQSVVTRMHLLACPMPSLDSLLACVRNNQASSAQVSLLPLKIDHVTGEGQGKVVHAIQGELSEMDTDRGRSSLLSPSKEEQLIFSSGAVAQTCPQVSLQSVFSSPQRASCSGGSETCAETVIDMFFRKVLRLAARRIKSMCDGFMQPPNVMEQIYKMTQYMLYQETSIFFNRHIDQIILCCIYGVCKVNRINLTFKSIVNEYRKQPQCKPATFRAVFMDRLGQKQNKEGGNFLERSDIIHFYNEVFVSAAKDFLLRGSNTCCNSTRAIMEDICN